MKNIAKERVNSNLPTAPLFTFDEILLNMKSFSNFKIIKEKSSYYEEANTFLSDERSSKLAGEAFEQFAKTYDLHELISVSSDINESLFYVAPNKTLLHIEKSMNNYKIITVITDRVWATPKISWIVRLFKLDFNPNTELMCNEIAMLLEDCKFFQKGGYCWERLYEIVINKFQPTVLTELLKEAINRLYQEQVFYTTVNNQLTVGDYCYRKGIVINDETYDEKALLIKKVADTYVELESEEVHYITELKDFSSNFGSVKERYSDAEDVINSAFCYYIQGDIINNILAGKKSECPVRYFKVSSDQDKSFHISNNTCKLYIQASSTTCANLVYTTSEAFPEFGTVFGTMLDVPYILLQANDGTLSKDDLELLLFYLNKMDELCENTKLLLLKSKMISDEFVNTVFEKISNNIERLCENWQVIYDRLVTED